MLRRQNLLSALGDERGQTFVEYALVLVMITGLALVAWANLGTAITTAIDDVITAIGA